MRGLEIAPTWDYNRSMTAMASINLDNFFTTAEAAAELGLSTDTLKKYCQLKRFRTEKVGRQWLVLREDIIKYQQDRREPGRPANESE